VYVCYVWQGHHGSWLLMLTFMCTYMYVCHCMTGWWLFNDNDYICIYLSIYVIVWHGCQGSFLWRNDCLCRRTTWRGSLSYEESIGKNSHNKYMRSVSCGYDLILYNCIMPMFMLWQVMLNDTSTKRKQCGPRHARIRMDRKLKERFCKDQLYTIYV